ncbi:MAG: Pvc16 family protein [Armatimonadota bacterium]|nr:Pvc16 family protein [Armatimonadota bacterium]
MIRDVDETLLNLLAGELPKLPGCPILDKAQITFAAPAVAEAVKGGQPRVNLYLHDLRENATMRDNALHLTRRPSDSTVGLRRGPVRLDLSYLVTAYGGDDPALEHRVLSDALTVLLRYSAPPARYLAGALPEEGSEALLLAVAQPEHLGHADAPALWQAMGGQMRAALSLVATAAFNPFETRWTRVVREVVLGVGQGTPPHGPQRPLDLSSVRVSAAGVVLDQVREQPLPGVSVEVDGHDAKAASDERGFFSLLNLPPGPRLLRFSRAGYQPQEMTVSVPPPGRPELLEPAVIALQPLDDAARAQQTAARAAGVLSSPALADSGRVYHASLSGTLRLPDGRPAAYIPVRVGAQQTMTDGEGVYFFVNLPPGEHAVIANLPGEGETEVARRDSAITASAAPPEPKRAAKK